MRIHNTGKDANWIKKKGSSHCGVKIENILMTKDIPVLPNCFQGKHISREQSITLVDEVFDDDRGRHQCNNLIYSSEQMPDREVGLINNNGWGKLYGSHHDPEERKKIK